jgi:hypothetical protein
MKRPHIVRQPPHGYPDQKWFKARPDRQYRIRPRRPDKPGKGFVIIKQIYPGCRLLVGIGPEGAMLADTDEVLGQVYDILRGKKVEIIFPHDSAVLGEDELEP